MKKTIIFGFSFIAVVLGLYFVLHSAWNSKDGYWDDNWYWYGKGLTENNKKPLYFNTQTKQNLFECGLAPVSIYTEENGLHSGTFYVNKDGKCAINKLFDSAGSFGACGLAPAKEGELWGYINTNGDFVIPPQYKYAGEFYSGIAIVKDTDHHYIINSSGEILHKNESSIRQNPTRPKEPSVFFCNEEGYGLAVDGRIVIPPQYSYIDNFKNGYAVVENNEKFGIADTSGDIVIPIEYDSAASAEAKLYQSDIQLSDTYAEYDNAQMNFEISDDNIMIDLSGSRLYDRSVYGVFNSGNARWFVNAATSLSTDKIGVVDKNGNFIVTPRFNSLCDPEQPSYSDRGWYHYSLDGYAFVFGDDDNYLIDRSGNIIFKMKDIEIPK